MKSSQARCLVRAEINHKQLYKAILQNKNKKEKKKSYFFFPHNVCYRATEDKVLQTHLRENNVVFSATLWTAHCSSIVSFLLLVEPALQTRLVDPLSAAFTSAGANPLCAVVVSLSGKTHPTVSGKHTHTHKVLLRLLI